MPTNKLFFLFLSTALIFINVEARAAIKPLYLNVSGEDPDRLPSEIMTKMRTVFVDPLDGGKAFALRSWMMQVKGPRNTFTFNLAFEPLSENSVDAFNQYVKSLESKNVLGSIVHFEPIQNLNYTAHVETGNYVGELEDPFVMSYQNPQNYSWKTLSQWSQFSNAFGEALLDQDHSRFKDFILSFISESGQSEKITSLLKVSDMMAIRSEIDIVLESGATIKQDSEATPFLPFRFFRNCFQSNFENGFCF